MTTSQPQRRFVEDFAAIDIGLLKRRGLFEPGAERSVEVETRGGMFQFAYRHPAGKISIRHGPEGRRASQTVELQVVQLPYGERRYFVCPITFERASKLYYVEGRLASRVGHSLVHLVTTNRKADAVRGRSINLANRLKGDALGKGPARGARKAEIITSLLGIGSAKWVDPDALEIIAKTVKAEEDQSYQEERIRRTRASSTANALEAGRVSPKKWTEEAVLRQLAEAMAMVADGKLPPMPELQLPPAHLHPRATLDVRALQTAGLLDPEELKGAALMWDRDVSGVINHTLLAADFRDPYKPFLVVENVDTYERVDYRQVIPVEFAADRWYLRCPFKGSRRTTLYLREGWFGSDKALNLWRKDWDPALDPKVTFEAGWEDLEDD